VSVFVGPRASRGTTGSLGGKIVHAFLLVFLLLIGLSIVMIVLVAPSPTAPCSSGQPCGAPPSAPAVIRETAWRSSQYGFSLDYPGSVATVSQQAPGRLVLATKLDGHSAMVAIQGLPPGTAPSQAIAEQVRGLKGFSQLARDGNPAHQLLGAGVGYVSGAGRAYVADVTSPQGSQPASVVSEAASNGHVTVTATVVGASSESGPRSGLYALADLIINSVQWPR
jgi:hypothetical protein